MPDDEPLSSTVTESVTTETGVDKEVAASLNAQFEDFWKEEDQKTDGAPEAPGAAQETREKPEPRSRTETKAEPKLSVSEPKEVSDEEIEKWGDLDEDPQNPQIKKQFSDIKALWQADRAKARAMRQEVDKLSAELAETRKNTWTPEAKADYEHAASIRRKFDFASDPDFLARFHTPITQTYQNILNEAIDVLPDRGAAQAWAKYISENYTPDQLDRRWWQDSVIAKVPNEMDRASLLQSVTHLLKMQRERDTEINRVTNDKSSFDNWVKEKTEFTAKRVQEEVMAEIAIQEKKIQEVLKRDPAEAKTKEEREAIEKHNERFEKLNSYFQDCMKDLSANGPRAWVRQSVEATRAQYIEGLYKEKEKALKSAEAERDQLRSELEKIQGVRRRISHTTGTPPASKDKDSGKNGGLSIRDLDIRKSFEKFDWGDGT
jgi:hypothetical protein